MPLQTEHVVQRNEARRLIDQKIVMHERSILPLKFQRNEVASVSRLPPEVLGPIFAFASAASAVRYRPSSSFNFSHVCRLWRNVALTTPGIWCFISLHYQQWATAMLERSKLADLVLDLNFATATSSTLTHEQFLKNVLDNHTSRIRELSLKGFSSSTLLDSLEDLQPSSLRLRSLQLVDLDAHRTPSFPIGIIANSEGLLDLDVVGCNIAWCSMPLTGLTSLKMDSNPTRPLWLDFITVLGGMPSLATLEIRDSLPMAVELRQRTSNPVRLTKLRRLDLGSKRDITEVLNVLSSIVVPQAASIKISGGTKATPNISLSLVSEFASSLSAFISEMISEHNHPMFYRELKVNSPYGQLALKARRGVCKSDRIRRTSSPDLDLSLSGLPYSAKKILPEFTKRLPLSKLKSLDLTGAVRKAAVLLECFGDLQKLRSVTLKGSVIRGFLQMLMVKAKGRDGKLTCPALQYLEILNPVFSPGHADGFSFEELTDCLMERCNHSAELRKLILSACTNLYAEDVALLQEIVVDVDWDQYYSEDEDEDEDDEDPYSFHHCHCYLYNLT